MILHAALLFVDLFNFVLSFLVFLLTTAPESAKVQNNNAQNPKDERTLSRPCPALALQSSRAGEEDKQEVCDIGSCPCRWGKATHGLSVASQASRR